MSVSQHQSGGVAISTHSGGLGKPENSILEVGRIVADVTSGEGFVVIRKGYV